MITTIDDINAAIETIQTENTDYPKQMEDRMDAAAYNEACSKIENQLNGLYEKIRLLEDIDEFCRNYAVKQIKEKESCIKESLKVIEAVSDVYKDSSNVSYQVPFQSGDENIRDRDGSVISRMVLSNGKLEAGSDEMASAPITSIAYTSNTACYNNSYGNLTKNKAGMSYYSTKEPPKDGIQEEIVVSLKKPTMCNHLEILPIGCKVSNIKLIEPDKNEYQISGTGYFPAKEIIGAKFRLTANKYTKEEKNAEADAYDNSGTFGLLETAYTRYNNEQLIKEMEISQAAAEKTYNVAAIETVCDFLERINAAQRQKNIKLSGEE